MVGSAAQMGDSIGPEPNLGLSMSPSPELEAMELLFAGHHGKSRLKNPTIPCHSFVICKTAPQSSAERVGNGSDGVGTGAGKEIFT